MAAVFAPPSGASSLNPYAVGAAGGAAAGIMVDRGVTSLKQTRGRANWALGIAVGLTALAAVSASDLNADQASAQATVLSASALTFTAGGALGAEVGALRSIVVQQGYLLAKVAYDASLFSFSGEPTPPVVTVSASALTQTAATTTTNNNIFVLALAILAVVAIIMMD